MTVLSADIEELVLEFLLARSDIRSEVRDGVYVGGLPVKPFWPVVVLWRLGGATVYPDWLDYPRLQFDVLANDQKTARRVARVLRASLQELPGTHDLGIVTDVTELGGLQYLPDPSYKPARPRYLFSVQLTVHPVS